MMFSLTSVLLLLSLISYCKSSLFDSDSCYSFGSGNVFPGGARKVDHKLQFTKAMISKPAPEWEATAVINGEFTQLSLSSFKGKYLVFFFYPLDFTFVCPTEILAFSERVEEFKKINTEVVACSVDSHFTHLAWINTPRKEGGLGKISIPLLSDLTHSIAKDYGVYLEDLGHTLRGLFIIDDKGILRQITMNDLPVGRSVDETLRLVQAFQYTDNHGEVCPAGWKPGQDTIIPNPAEKKKYFEKIAKYYQHHIQSSSFSTKETNNIMVDPKHVVRYEDMLKVIQQPEKVIIDVRNPDEVNSTGKIPSSINIPLNHVQNVLTSMSDADFQKKYNRNKPSSSDELIFYCQSGRRSSEALDKALKLGYSNSKTYLGSWNDWSSRKK